MEFDRSIAPVVQSKHPHIARFLPILWILLLSWLVLFHRLGSTGLLDETEPLFAEAARQMKVTGDWITPYFNGVTRFDKPPLIYWLMAIAYGTIGVNEWAARLPSAISGTLLIGFCFYTLRFFEQKLKSRAKILPFLGSAIFALNLQTLFFGRLGYSDMLLSVCFGGSLLSFFWGYAHPENPKVQTRFYLAFYGWLALAVLTKGPVGVVLPGTIVLIFLVCVGKVREVLKEIKLVPGIVIFLGLSVPWYVLAYLRNGDGFINSFFGYHNLGRFTHVVNQHQGAWYFHSLIVLIGFFPWSIYLPVAIAHRLRDRSWRQQPRSSHLGLFALIWFAIVLGFFTIAATKYITYTLPLVPAAAILVSLWWSDQREKTAPNWGLKASVYVSLALCVTLAAVTFYSPHWLNRDPSMPQLGLRMQEAGLPQIGGLIWLGGAIGGTFLILKRKLHLFWGVNLATYAAFILFFITPFIGVLDRERQLPLREVAQIVNQVRQANEPIVMATNSFEKPSLVFYTHQPITFFNRSAKIKPYLEQVRQQKTQRSILMVTTDRTLKEAEILPQSYQRLNQVGIYQVIRFSVLNQS
ncbi:ArnT family glycosyltransferase [Phormidesmis priestleyi]|uniref:ArnT family glycosyltransferase n=1 Tax=Phormidesmis priestleyi TaxID=268141 RepID=UPI00083AAF5F|nr:glycosyltransferase family 39 protein [Phormidesmis priestleyi]